MPGVIFFKSTEVWGGGEKLTISIAEIVSKFQISNFLPRRPAGKFQKVLLISNNQRVLKEANAHGLSTQLFDLGLEVARRRDIPGFLFRKPLLRRKITQLLSGYQADYHTVVLQSLNERLLITPIAKKFGYRVIWLEFQPWTPFLVKHPYLERLVNLTPLVNQIIVNSRFAKQELVDLGIGEQQVKVLHSFVDTDHFKPSQGNKKRSPEHPFTIVTVARLHQEKGIDILIDGLSLGLSHSEPALASSSDESGPTRSANLSRHSSGTMPDWPARVSSLRQPFARATILNVIGDGPERANLEQQVKRLGLDSQVQFLGEKTDVLPYLQAADLFVLPSRRDNLPVALLEAMAGGLPSIATSVGGIPEVIEDGENGLLVPPDNPESLTKAIRRLIDDQRLQKKLGSNARQTAQDKFGLKIFRETVKNYFLNAW